MLSKRNIGLNAKSNLLSYLKFGFISNSYFSILDYINLYYTLKNSIILGLYGGKMVIITSRGNIYDL
jgi:hypothetical protein